MLFLPRPRVTERTLEKTQKESVEWQKSMVQVPVPPPTGKPASLFRLNAITSNSNRASYLQPRRKHIIKPPSVRLFFVPGQ